MIFSFMNEPSLLHTCQHALRKTFDVLKRGVAGGGTADTEAPSFAYELNDMRPIPRPAEMQRIDAKLADIFFVVTQYADGYAVSAVLDAGVYERDVVETLLTEWMQMWVSGSPPLPAPLPPFEPAMASVAAA
jgi:hypothetical protein